MERSRKWEEGGEGGNWGMVLVMDGVGRKGAEGRMFQICVFGIDLFVDILSDLPFLGSFLFIYYPLYTIIAVSVGKQGEGRNGEGRGGGGELKQENFRTTYFLSALMYKVLIRTEEVCTCAHLS